MNKYIPPRTRVGLAVASGILALVLARGHFKKAESRLNARYEMGTALVSRKYVAPGKELKADMVEERKIPAAFIEPTAITRLENLKNSKGAGLFKARIGLLKGEQITRSKLAEAEGGLGLAWTLSPGQTAVSLKLSAEQAVAGHIKPGDWVSVFGVFDLQPGVSEPEASQILARCQILGVQEQLLDPNDGAVEKIDWKDLSNDAILVTLSLNPEQINRLMLASMKSQLFLGLQSALSSTEARVAKVKLSQMVKN